MKTRRVIGTATISSPCKELLYNRNILHEIDASTKVELAIYEDVPPKRELIVPEGLTYIESQQPNCHDVYYLSLNGKTIGWYKTDYSVGQIWLSKNNYTLVKPATRKDMLEALANNHWHNFGWEEEWPDWSGYEWFVVCGDKEGVFAWTDEDGCREGIVRRKIKNNVVTTIGITADGHVDVLPTWKREESEASNGL